MTCRPIRKSWEKRFPASMNIGQKEKASRRFSGCPERCLLQKPFSEVILGRRGRRDAIACGRGRQPTPARAPASSFFLPKTGIPAAPYADGFSSAETGNFSALGVVPFLEKFAEKLFPRFDRFSGMFFLHMFHIGLIARHADEQTDELFPVAPGIF